MQDSLNLGYLFFVFALLSPVSYAETNITALGEGGIENWSVESFQGQTGYEVLPVQGIPSIRAISDGTASSLYIERPIDLQETPYLNWSWLTTQYLPQADERSKSGDDYVARIYLVIKGGLFGWGSKSICYLWSSSQHAGLNWDSPYVGSDLQLVSVRGQEDGLNQWYSEKQNVYQDFIRLFGDKGSEEANLKAYGHVDVIAIMTDTDNGESFAETYYRDLIFTAE